MPKLVLPVAFSTNTDNLDKKKSFVFKGHSRPLFSFIFIFWIKSIVKNVQFKFCWWLDSNFRTLVLEATALPMESQPLPNIVSFLDELSNRPLNRQVLLISSQQVLTWSRCDKLALWKPFPLGNNLSLNHNLPWKKKRIIDANICRYSCPGCLQIGRLIKLYEKVKQNLTRISWR